MDALRKHLTGGTAGQAWWITVYFEQTTMPARAPRWTSERQVRQLAEGPYTELGAKRRARYLLQHLPDATDATTHPDAIAPRVSVGARWMALATRTDGTRLAYGPCFTRKAAIAQFSELIRHMPHSIPEDYDYRVHYVHDATAYRRTRRAG